MRDVSEPHELYVVPCGVATDIHHFDQFSELFFFSQHFPHWGDCWPRYRQFHRPANWHRHICALRYDHHAPHICCYRVVPNARIRQRNLDDACA